MRDTTIDVYGTTLAYNGTTCKLWILTYLLYNIDTAR